MNECSDGKSANGADINTDVGLGVSGDTDLGTVGT